MRRLSMTGRKGAGADKRVTTVKTLRLGHASLFLTWKQCVVRHTCGYVVNLQTMIMHLFCVFSVYTSLLTHRAWYVCAVCPLTVGPRRGCTTDFLLLAQQFAVLLLFVLHVDQQRNKAVLDLHHTQHFSKLRQGFGKYKAERMKLTDYLS